MKRPFCPVAVKVGAHTYRIEKTPAARMVSEGDKLLGDQDPDALRIRLRKGLRYSKQQEILIHEILHACTYPAFQNGDDEPFVDAVSHVVLQVLQENPQLIEFLTHK